jgi:hypothetical protein
MRRLTREWNMQQTLFEIGFVLAITLPPLTILLSAGALAVSSFVYLPSHAAVGSHRPVGS